MRWVRLLVGTAGMARTALSPMAEVGVGTLTFAMAVLPYPFSEPIITPRTKCFWTNG